MMVHSSFSLEAQVRPEGTFKRGINKRLRREQQIPGVIYGKHLKASIPIVLDEKTLLRSLADEAFHSHLLKLKVAGETHTVVLRAVKRKHDKRHSLLHIDFQQVDAKEPITMSVPLHVEGAEACESLNNGTGILTKMIAEIQVRCLPGDLPEFLSLDIAKAQLHDTLHLSDIALPKGIEIVELSHGAEHDQPVLSIHEPKVVQEPEPEVAADGAEAKPEGEGDTEAAPSADAEGKTAS